MKWVIYFLCILLFITSSYALTVQKITHTSFSDNYFIIVTTPTNSLNLIFTNHTYYSSELVYKIIIPLETITLENLTHNDSSSDVVFKISNPLLSLRIQNLTHITYSNSLIFNITTINSTQTVLNNSKYYVSFIDSINTSTPIVVGKNGYDDYLLEKYDVGMKGFVKYHDKIGVYPFNGLIISATINGNRNIFVYGNAIEGEIAALRYLKKHKDEFIYLDNSYFLNDVDALSVYDYMHTNDTREWYNKDCQEFSAIINKSLFGMVEENIIDIKTNEGVLLRVMQVDSLNSEKFVDYVNNNTLPLVFARGLWSNLYPWQNFGVEMAEKGRKVYLIEITGGPGQDCDTCVNYNFSDLTNSYWPVMIATIQALNNNSQIQYVGHSNGARTGISSLEIYNEIGKNNAGSYFNGGEWINVSMTKHPIETYIAAGMPGAFEGVNPTVLIINKEREDIDKKIALNNLTHITLGNLIAFGLTTIKYLSQSTEDKISQNLWNDYSNWMFFDNDSQPGKNVNISNFLIIQGDALITSDGIVSTKDEEMIYNNINSDNKKYISVVALHGGTADSKASKRIINSFITNKNLDDLKINYTFQPLIKNQIYGGVIINETK